MLHHQQWGREQKTELVRSVCSHLKPRSSRTTKPPLSVPEEEIVSRKEKPESYFSGVLPPAVSHGRRYLTGLSTRIVQCHHPIKGSYRSSSSFTTLSRSCSNSMIPSLCFAHIKSTQLRLILAWTVLDCEKPGACYVIKKVTRLRSSKEPAACVMFVNNYLLSGP